jgi:glutamate carboxypeptidase
MLQFDASSTTQQTASTGQWAQKFLQEILPISSATPEKLGVEECQDAIAQQLIAMGFEVRLTPSPDPFGPMLIAEKRGKRKDFISFVSHSDTVLPFTGLQRDGDRWIASGAIDNKGGLTVALAGLREYLQNDKKENLSLRFVCAPNEEMGSVHWISRYKELSQDTWMALGFEPALDDGSIVHARRGNRWYQIRITGKEAHAGRSYGEHVNAAHELAWKVHRMQKLTNYLRHRSVNVGHISGGRDRFNVVCGHAEAKLDVRFLTFRDRDKLHRRIVRILERKRHPSTCGRYLPETTYEIMDDCPPFAPSYSSRKWIKAYVNSIAAVEKAKPQSKLAGGAGDVNHFSRPGVIVLDGLGPIGGNMHTEQEFLHVPSLGTRSLALANFLRTIS